MARPENPYFKSMCIFTYEHNNNILTTIVYFTTPNYDIVKFHNSCVLVAKINNCLTLNVINGNERVIVELNRIIPTIEVSVSLVRQIQDAINRQLTTLII